jgi:CubicO group peptidase (beta-lactamase class C family)
MKNILIVLIFILISNSVNSQPKYRLTSELTKELQSTLNKQNGDLSAAVIFPNGDIWEGTSGFLYDSVSIKKEMLFNIGSITKIFTAAAILKLADEGKVSLEDSIYKWLPSYKYIDSTITIRQLLNNTSGIFDFVDTLSFYDTLARLPDKIWTPEEVIRSFLQQPVFPKGTAGRYSNTNFLLAGMIICKVTGKSLSTVFRENFFEPLGLNNTYLYPEENYTGEICQFDPASQPYILALTKASLSCAGAAAGLLSRPRDMVKWGKAIYGDKIISLTMLHDMTAFKKLSQQSRINYGLGTECFNFTKNNIVIHAYGHDGEWAHRSTVAYFPGDSIAIAVCRKQDSYVYNAAQALYKTVYGSALSEPLIKVYKTINEIKLKARIFFPPNFKKSENHSAFVFYYGKNWFQSSPDSGYNICRHFASLGMVAFAVEYRPVNQKDITLSEIVGDAKSAIRWIRSNGKELGIDTTKIVCCGYYAGGYLAACTSFINGYDEKAEDLRISSKPNVLMLISPSLSPEIDPGFTKTFNQYKVTDELSPVYNIQPHSPNTFIIHGEADNVVPKPVIDEFIKKMQETKNIYELHSFENTGHIDINNMTDFMMKLADSFLVIEKIIESKQE